MTINFKTLHMVNFLSYIDSFIDLDSEGFILVNGINNNAEDCSKSNGSGKSAIWDAISWALTGETIRGVKSIRNVSASDGTLVELSFDYDNNSYHIIRSKEHSEYKSDLKIFINDVDKSGKGLRESEKLLQSYLPELTSYLIGSVIILGQGLPQKLSSETPSGRKNILEKLSKSDFMIEDLKERIQTRHSELSNSMRALQDESLKLDTLKESSTQILSKLEADLESLMDSSSIDDKLNSTQEALERCSINVSKLTKEISDLTSAKEELDKNLNLIHDAFTEESTKLNSEYNESINRYNIKLAELSTQKRLLENEIKQIKAMTDVCPTCGQKIPEVVIPDCSAKEAELSELISGIEMINKDIAIAKECLSQNMNNLNIKYDCSDINAELASVISQLSNAELNKSQLNIKIAGYQSALGELINRKQTFTQTLNKLQNDIESEKTRQVEIQDKKLYNSNEIENIKLHIEVNNKMNNIVKRDFRGFLLQNVIEYINKKCKEYSLEVFNKDNIEFKLDGNDICIEYCGKQYEALSGGEKQKLDVIIQLAIRAMLCTYLNFNSNILVLDEVFDSMDVTSCQQILELISNALSDVKSIYVITHRQELNIPYDKIITIIKDSNGISTIQ